jgi:hypothetical protein
MSNPIYIDASKARNNFANIINAVYLENKSYIIKKSGIPIVKISKAVDSPKETNFFDLAGLISESEAKKMTRLYKSGRADGSRLKKKLA